MSDNNEGEEQKRNDNIHKGMNNFLDKVREWDKSIESPEARTQKIYNLLLSQTELELTDWDIICFAVNALGYLSAAHPWLQDDARRICRLVYTAHYEVLVNQITGDGQKLDTQKPNLKLET